MIINKTKFSRVYSMTKGGRTLFFVSSTLPKFRRLELSDVQVNLFRGLPPQQTDSLVNNLLDSAKRVKSVNYVEN